MSEIEQAVEDEIKRFVVEDVQKEKKPGPALRKHRQARSRKNKIAATSKRRNRRA